MKKNYIVDKFINTENGFKDRLRNIYSIQFFDLNNVSDSDGGENESLSINKLNNPEENLEFTLFSRSVSGLPEFGMNEVEDTFFNGYKSILPGAVEDPSGTLSIDVIATEKMTLIDKLFLRLFKLYQTQVSIDDFITILNNEGEIEFDKGIETNLPDTIVENIPNSLSPESNIYFKMSVNSLSYLQKETIISYLLYNCWVKKITIHDSMDTEGSANLAKAKVQIRYDLGRISKPSKN